MNNKLLLILFILSPSFIFSQYATINKGKIIKDRQFLIDKTEITACDDNGNFISIRPHRINGSLRNYFVEFFNDLDFLERVEIKTDNFTEILEVFIKNEKAHILIKEYNNEKATLRFDLFDLKGKSHVRKNLLKAEKKINKELFNTLKHKSSISINHENDYVLSYTLANDKTIYTCIKSFDKNLNALSSHEVYPDKNIHRKHITFLNVTQYNQKTYLLYSILNKNKESYYQLTEFFDNKSRNLVIPIESDTYQLINTKISGENFIIGGLFSKRKKGAFEGYSYYKVNLETFSLFSKQSSNFISEDAKKYFNGIFKRNRSIDIKDIIIDENLNIYLVSQFYSIRKQYSPIGIPIASFATSTFTAFISFNPINVSYKVYDKILISKINTNGELIWDKILEMRETQKINSKSNKKDSSYYAFLDKNQLSILINGYIDIKKNKLIINQDKRNSKTNFYTIKVSPNGELTPETIFPNADSDILFRAENSIRFNNSIYNLGQGNMRKQLLKLEF